MSREEMLTLAKAAVEKFIGDVAEEGFDQREEAYCLAFDALVDKGVNTRTAGEIAVQVADLYPSPD